MTKTRILLSVIVPVYNAEPYIRKCVESILKQNYFMLEIILVDDGSSDGSGRLCDLLERENNNVKVLHIENSGIVNARLKGVKASEGKWITFVDADDWIGEEAYRDIIPERNCDMVVTGICRYIDGEHQIMQRPFWTEGIYNKEQILHDVIPIMLWNPALETWAFDPSLCTKIFKRQIILSELEKASKVGSDYGEDSMVIFPMMLQVENIKISEKIYYYHRQRPEGMIAPYIADQDFISKLYSVYKYLKERFKNTEYWNIMKNQLDCFYMSSVELKKRCFTYSSLEFSIYFPFDKISWGSRVVLYGAGKVGNEYWRQNSLYHFCKIVSWVDVDYKKKQNDYHEILHPEIIKETVYDYILIAVDDYHVAREIISYLKEFGVMQEKVIWQSARVLCKIFDDF